MTVTNFVFTGGAQTYTVPSGVTSLVCDLVGADGANFDAIPGGSGAHIRFTLAVTPGAVIQVNVGGSGLEGAGLNGGSPGAGGWNGGGNGGFCNNGPGGNGGGGASDIRVGGTALSNRVGVAGAGGASCGITTNSPGGGGGPLGGNGTTAGTTGANAGLGGTQTAGGASVGGGGVASAPGSLGVGSAGTSNAGGASDVSGGGGAGGGYYGGSGGGATTGTGGNPGGGGGGSSWASGTGVSSASTIASGTQGGGVEANGSITITTSDTAPNAPTLTSPTANGFADVNNCVLSWTFSDPDSGDTQSSADIRYRVSGTTNWTTLSGVVTGTASSYQLTGLTPGVTYEWQVRTYDSQAVVGPYSSSSFFIPKVSLFVSILTPTSGQPVTSLAATPFTFTLQRDMNGVSARRVGDINGVADPTTVYETVSFSSSAITSVTFSNTSHNDGPEHWQVQLKAFNSQIVSQWFDVYVVMSVDAPATPVVTATPTVASASINVTASFEELSVDYFGLVSNPTNAQTGQALTYSGSSGTGGTWAPSGNTLAYSQATLAGKVRSMSCAFRQNGLGSTNHNNNIYMIATDASSNAHIYCGIDAQHWYIKLDTAGTLTTLASGALSVPITTSAANATPWFMWASFSGTTVTFQPPSGGLQTATNAAIGTFTGTIARLQVDNSDATNDDTWKINHWAADSTANNVAITGYFSRSIDGKTFTPIPGAVWDAEEYGAVITYTDYTPPFNRQVWYQAVGVTATGAIAKSVVS